MKDFMYNFVLHNENNSILKDAIIYKILSEFYHHSPPETLLSKQILSIDSRELV
jgi:hypothetical protein